MKVLQFTVCVYTTVTISRKRFAGTIFYYYHCERVRLCMHSELQSVHYNLDYKFVSLSVRANMEGKDCILSIAEALQDIFAYEPRDSTNDRTTRPRTF